MKITTQRVLEALAEIDLVGVLKGAYKSAYGRAMPSLRGGPATNSRLKTIDPKFEIMARCGRGNTCKTT